MFDLATTRIIHQSEPDAALRPWVWPLPTVNGFAPKLLDDSHDVGQSPRDVLVGYEPHVALPSFVPVFAVRDGVVTYGGKISSGFTVAVDHAGGWSTQYGGMAHMFVCATDRFRRRRKERVRAGDVLGYLGLAVPRLRFELATYSEEDGHEPVDPIHRMRRWVFVPWTEKRHEPAARTGATRAAA